MIKKWQNDCDKTAPAALRYLAENDRPSGGESLYNAAHLYQIAAELEATALEAALSVPVPAQEAEEIDSLAAEFMDGFTNGNGVWSDMPDFHKDMYREGVKLLLSALHPTLAHSGEAEAWRCEIQYGPEGEANYAWVYRGKDMVATMKTHHAIAVVNAMNGSPAHSGEREALERRIRSAGLKARDEVVDGIRGDGSPDNDLADYLERIVDACVCAALEGKQP